MKLLLGTLALSIAFAADDAGPSIPLTVPAGAPLRLYLTRKVSKRAGARVEAKVLEPVYAFDHEVVPAGTEVLGKVSRVQSLPKWQRIRAMLGGDFTPLHRAQVEFTTLVMPDGRQVPLRTVETEGLHSVYRPKPPKKQKPQQQASPNPNGGVLGTGKQKVKDQIDAQINGRIQAVKDVVHGPDKKQRLLDFAMSKLPYHPQRVRAGTRFDAELRDPLQFGSEPVRGDSFGLLGTQPAADSTVHARLVTPLDSSTAKKGEAVEAVIMEPLFSPDHKLVLPEGTRLTGSVVLARRARWLHRAGQLRFNFLEVDLPEEVALLKPAESAPAVFRTQAILQAAESGGKAAIKVDGEGGVKATESKTRLLAPMISIMIANRSADTDVGRHAQTTGATNDNVAGRTMGGGLGFGLLGTAIAQSSKYVGAAFGYYGVAWSVYSNVLGRGAEVEFPKNAVIDIRFAARPLPASKFRAD